MSAVSTHRAVAPAWVKAVLTADLALDVPGSLRNLTATDVNSEVKSLGGVYYPMIPQNVDPLPYPAIIIQPPYPVSLAGRMQPNGDNIVGARFGQDVVIAGRDFALDEPGLDAMLERIITLLNGQSGTVDGGRVTHCRLSDPGGYLSPQYLDKGGYIYVQLGLNFTIATKTT